MIVEVPGEAEVILARRFFAALQQGDVPVLAALLDDAAKLSNMDGPVEASGRHALAARLAGHGGDVEYRLDSILAAPGLARARFILVVAGVPGGIVLDAHLTFERERIVSIVVRPPDPADASPARA